MTSWKVLRTQNLIDFLEARFAEKKYPSNFNILHVINRLYLLLPDFPMFPTPITNGLVDSAALAELVEGKPEDEATRSRTMRPETQTLANEVRSRATYLRKNQGRTR